METMHVGVLGGTFDPVHNGHIFVAEYVRTHLGLDRVYFVTAKLPPHKSHHMADAEVRHAMVEAAVKDKHHLVPCRLAPPIPSIHFGSCKHLWDRMCVSI